MGALEYKPAEQDGIPMEGGALDLHHLSELADMLLKNKEAFAERLSGTSSKSEMLGIIRIGSSAGGARAKALVATDSRGSFYDGTVDHGPDLRYWLLKFDVGSNSEHGSKDPKGMTRVEYLYSRMAKECGIDIPETDFIADGEDFHFMIERFDRIVNNKKLERLHYVSWAGAKHYDRDATGAYSYEQLVMAIREMELGQDALTEIFRRAVFNVVGRNQDDHTKNFGFLMNKRGEWRLSPAFDMTYAYDPTGKWTRSHQISLNGKQDGFTRDDLLAFGKFCNLNATAANDVIEKCVGVFSGFAKRAEALGVAPALLETIETNLRYRL
jgi:serine/threonine-protein kinase HipA